MYSKNHPSGWFFVLVVANMNTMKFLSNFLLPAGIFLFPFVYFSVDFHSIAFPKVVFIFLISNLSLLFLLWGGSKSSLEFPKSWVGVGLAFYILILFLAGLLGANFSASFWSSFNRMNGIVTWVNYFILFITLSGMYARGKASWVPIFRSLGLSLLFLSSLDFLKFFNIETPQFFGNSTYLGIYLVLGFFLLIIGFILEHSKYWKCLYVLASISVFFNPFIFELNPGRLFVGEARASGLVMKLGLILVAFLWLLHKKLSYKKVVLVSSALIFLILGIWGYGFNSILRGQGFVYEAYVRETGVSRPIVWGMALSGIQESPWLGYGPENFTYVFQENLDSRLIQLEDFPWFDRAHNFVLDSIIAHGYIGIFVLAVLFIIVVKISFSLYLRDREFYFLIIPFILILHFLQMQTSFETYNGLFLVFILLAFLVSSEGKVLKIVIPPNFVLGFRTVSLGVVLCAIWFWIAVPVSENRLIAKISNSGMFQYRIDNYPKLEGAKFNPVNTLRFISSEYTRAIFLNFENIQNSEKLKDRVVNELNAIISLYDSHYDKQYLNYKYLVNYSSLLANSIVVGIDKMDKAEEIARKALAISDAYPHPVSVLEARNKRPVVYIPSI